MIETKITESAKNVPEDTRSRIIVAAREVIARKGKRGATTREIGGELALQVTRAEIVRSLQVTALDRLFPLVKGEVAA